MQISEQVFVQVLLESGSSSEQPIGSVEAGSSSAGNSPLLPTDWESCAWPDLIACLAMPESDLVNSLPPQLANLFHLIEQSLWNNCFCNELEVSRLYSCSLKLIILKYQSFWNDVSWIWRTIGPRSECYWCISQPRASSSDSNPWNCVKLSVLYSPNCRTMSPSLRLIPRQACSPCSFLKASNSSQVCARAISDIWKKVLQKSDFENDCRLCNRHLTSYSYRQWAETMSEGTSLGVSSPAGSAAEAAKARLRWTAELHDKFVAAVAKLGGPDRKSIHLSRSQILFCIFFHLCQNYENKWILHSYCTLVAYISKSSICEDVRVNLLSSSVNLAVDHSRLTYWCR